ncbi:MAG: hypothetical protein EXS24_05015 [Pedosphaera sp.]|nr:hypothetical protein [Pedosphaera sp.]
MGTRILLLDFQGGKLASLAHDLGPEREWVVAANPAEAAALLGQSPSFAAVVCNCDDSGTETIAFLTHAFECAPKTPRILLVSRARADLLFEAVNRDHVFAFVPEDSSPESFLHTIESAEKQHAASMAETELLEKTFSGSLQLLSEVLALVAPTQFGRSQKLREYIHLIGTEMKMKNLWELETAAMLAPLGYVTLPPLLLKKVNAGEELTSDEQQIVAKLPVTTSQLISHLPRLERVAEMIKFQNKNYNGSGFPSDVLLGDQIPMGARMLKVLNDLLDLEAKKKFKPTALTIMRDRFGIYDPVVLDVTHTCLVVKAETADMAGVQLLSCADVKAGQLLMENAETKDGMIILSAGSRISKLALERFRNYAELGVLKEPMFVK